MKSLKTLCVIIVTVCAVAPALAADQIVTPPTTPLMSSMKIAVVNVQTIMRDSTAAKSGREQLEAKKKAYQLEISRKEDALRMEDQDLTKQQATLPKDVFEQKVKAFRSKAAAVDKEVAARKEEWDNAYQNSVKQIQRTVDDILIEIAKAKGFSIVLPASQVLYADSALDLTPEVLGKLNARLPSIAVKFEAPAASDSAISGKSKKKQD